VDPKEERVDVMRHECSQEVIGPSERKG